MSGPIPARVDAAAKARLLELIDDAIEGGWSFTRACATLELDRGRAWRWTQRRCDGRLDDAVPGGHPIHGLLDWEINEILALFDEWADVDRTHRKVAHCGPPCPAGGSTASTRFEDAVARLVRVAETVSGDERERLWSQAVRSYAGYAGYQARTDRQIPVLRLSPTRPDDRTHEALTQVPATGKE